MIKVFQLVLTRNNGAHGEGVAEGLVGVEKPLPGLDLIIFALVRSGPVHTLSGLSWLQQPHNHITQQWIFSHNLVIEYLCIQHVIIIYTTIDVVFPIVIEPHT